MEPQRHLLTSVILAGAAWPLTCDWSLTAGIVAGGIAIDLDHLPEVWRVGWYRTWSEFRFLLDHQLHARLFLLLHSWEIYLLVLLTTARLAVPGWLIGLALGGLLHLVCDQATNPVNARAYFLAYRLAVAFDGARLFTGREYRRRRELAARLGVKG